MGCSASKKEKFDVYKGRKVKMVFVGTDINRNEYFFGQGLEYTGFPREVKLCGVNVEPHLPEGEVEKNAATYAQAYTYANVVVLMYNCGSQKSFEAAASYWPEQLKKVGLANLVLLGMENSESKRNEAEAKELCEKHGFAGPFFANKDDGESCTKSFHDILTYLADHFQ